MIYQLKEQMKQLHMLEKEDRILIGLSGGADSVCLAQMLWELVPEFGWKLGAVCCHHGLRGEEADEDVRFAKQFCLERGISFYFEKEQVEERAVRNGQSLEEAGREFRYETFRRIMREEGYNKLAVAHHADDRAETMLFHLARGTGIAGLCTMEPVRDFDEGKLLVRPLLWFRKTQMEEWLRGKGIAWREDQSNLEDVYSRNRIRHHILPEMEKLNERAVEHMGNTADQLLEIQSYLNEAEEELFEKAVHENEGRWELNLSLLDQSHSYMKKRILYRCLALVSGGKKDLSAAHIDILVNLMEGQSGKENDFPGDVRVRKEYDRMIFVKGRESAGVKQENILKNLHFSMEKVPFTGQEILKNEYTKQFDCDKIQKELCLRFWQPGDYLYLREDGGKKKLNRYFIDARIPQNERDTIPLLADGSHIVWIVGHRISAYYKVTEQTRQMLVVTIKNEG